MIPMRTSSIFKSRWLALLWAAGILWFAYDVAGGSDASTETNAEQPTDVTGAPVSNDDAKHLQDVINGL
ncbi:MAG: hypothetical protein ABIS38_06155 [Sphingomicrobium sp.]